MSVAEYESYDHYTGYHAVPTTLVEYDYDVQNQLIGRTVSSEDSEVMVLDSEEVYINQGGQIVLHYEDDAAGPLDETDLSHRYLWGTETDELLADEVVDDGTADDVLWALGDHLNSVRDLVQYQPATDTVVVREHNVYDAYGNRTIETEYDANGNLLGTTGAIESLFLYTGRLFDAETGLQNNLNRWYDAAVGSWLGVDPIGFDAEDANLYRYCGNGSTYLTDPNGLQAPVSIGNPRNIPPIPIPTSPVDLKGNAVAPYVRFRIIKSGWGDIPGISGLNNQNFLRQWYRAGCCGNASDARAIPNTGRAHSIVHSAGDFCCNNSLTGKTGSLGAIAGYITNLAPGTYQVTYTYDIYISAQGKARASATLTETGQVKPVSTQAVKGISGSRMCGISRSGIKTRVVTVTVGADGEAQIFKYDPSAATPHGAKCADYAKASGWFNIIEIKEITTSTKRK